MTGDFTVYLPPPSSLPLSSSLAFLFKFGLCYLARTRVGIPAARRDERLGSVHLLANFCVVPSNTNETRKLRGTARHGATTRAMCLLAMRELHSATKCDDFSFSNFSGTLVLLPACPLIDVFPLVLITFNILRLTFKGKVVL